MDTDLFIFWFFLGGGFQKKKRKKKKWKLNKNQFKINKYWNKQGREQPTVTNNKDLISLL